MCLHEKDCQSRCEEEENWKKGCVSDDSDSMPVSQRTIILTLFAESLRKTPE